MIHLVFNEPDIKVLQQAQELDSNLAGEIVQIKDDYAVGPIAELDTPEGWQARRSFWQEALEAGGDTNAAQNVEMVDDKLTVHHLTKALDADPDEKIWIWAAQNHHDVSGYYWLISRLQAWQGRVYILYLNNLPFINEKGGVFYPSWLSEIQPREYLKAQKLARVVTPAEFEVDADEWARLAAGGKMVRRLEGGKKLAQFDADYFDASLAKYVMGDFVKMNRVMSQFFSKEKETTGDVYAIWRLRQLAQTQQWETRGDWGKGGQALELKNPKMPGLPKKDLAESAGTPS